MGDWYFRKDDRVCFLFDILHPLSNLFIAFSTLVSLSPHPTHPLTSSNPATGKVITKLHEASPADVDAAVDAAHKAFSTTWGLNTSGVERGKLMMKLADLMDAHNQELASIETLDNGMFSHLSSFTYRDQSWAVLGLDFPAFISPHIFIYILTTHVLITHPLLVIE